MAGKRKDERPTHKRYNAERRDLINKAKRILRNNLPKYKKTINAEGKQVIDYTQPIAYNSKFELQDLVNKYIEESKKQGAIGAAKSLLIQKNVRMEEKRRVQFNKADARDSGNFQKIRRKKKIYDPEAEAKRKADQSRRAARRTEV